MQGDIEIKKGVKTAVQAVANGTTVQFFFNFPVFKENELFVWVDSVKIAVSDYTIAGIHKTDGGSITFKSAPIKDSIITLARATVPERLADYTSHSTISSESINEEFDRLFAIAQDSKNQQNKSLQSPAHKNTNFNHALPTLTAGKVIGVKADGTGLEMVLSNADGLDQIRADKIQVATNTAQVRTDKAQVSADKAQVRADKTQVSADKTQVSIDKAQVRADKTQVSADKAQVHVDKTQVSTDKAQVRADKIQVSTDKAQVRADKIQVSTDKAQVHADKTQVSADKAQVATDKAQVRADKAIVTSAVANLPKTSNFAKKDLSNILNADFKAKGVASGLGGGGLAVERIMSTTRTTRGNYSLDSGKKFSDYTLLIFMADSQTGNDRSPATVITTSDLWKAGQEVHAVGKGGQYAEISYISDTAFRLHQGVYLKFIYGVK